MAPRLTAGQRGLPAACGLPRLARRGCWAPAGRWSGSNKSSGGGSGEGSGRRRGGASRPAPGNLSDKWQSARRARCSLRRAAGSRGGTPRTQPRCRLVARRPRLPPPPLPRGGSRPAAGGARCGAGCGAPPLRLQSVSAGCGLSFYLSRVFFFLLLNNCFAVLLFIFLLLRCCYFCYRCL